MYMCRRYAPSHWITCHHFKSLQKPGLGSWVTYPVHELAEVQSQTPKKDPQNGWFVMEHPMKMDDLRVPQF